MARGIRLQSRVTAVVLVGVSVTACGQFAGLKAKKHLKDAQRALSAAGLSDGCRRVRGGDQGRPELDGGVLLPGQQLRQPVPAGRARARPSTTRYLDEAVKNYERSVEKLADSTDPQEVELRKRSLQYLAAVYASDKQNDPEKAEPVVKRLIDLDPKDTTNYFGLAKIYEDNGEFDEAEEQMKLPRRPRRAADVSSQLSEFYNRRGEFDKAITAFQKVTELEPNNPQHFTNIALATRRRSARTTRSRNRRSGIHQARHGGRRQGDRDPPDYFEALTYKNLLLRQQAIGRAGARERADRRSRQDPEAGDRGPRPASRRASPNSARIASRARGRDRGTWFRPLRSYSTSSAGNGCPVLDPNCRILIPIHGLQLRSISTFSVGGTCGN